MKRTRKEAVVDNTSESSDSDESVNFEYAGENEVSENDSDSKVRVFSPTNSNVPLQERLLQNAKAKIWKESGEYEPTIHSFVEENCGAQVKPNSVLDTFKVFFTD